MSHIRYPHLLHGAVQKILYFYFFHTQTEHHRLGDGASIM